MLTLIGIFLIFSAISALCEARDWEASERNADLRNKELIESLARQDREMMASHKEQRKTARRTIKDTDGKVLTEEVILEELEDF